MKSLAFSPDGSQLVSGFYANNAVRIWNTTTGELQAELKGHTSSVESIAFSQDGSRIISGSRDNKVRIWNAITGREEVKLIGHTGWVLSAAFSKDGAQVVSTSCDHTVRTWNATTGKAQAVLKGHTDWVRSAVFSQDGSTVVSASRDKTVRMWEVTTGKCQLMAIGDTTLSLHGSVVRRIGNTRLNTRFHIIYPGQEPALWMSGDQQWIVGPLHDCWVPAYHRGFTSSAFWGNKMCLGYASGRVVIFDMTSTIAE